MGKSWKNSVVLIESSDPSEESFGTGFIIYKDRRATYLLTCTHVVREIGGSEQIKIDDAQARIIASSPEKGAVLTILCVGKLLDGPPLPLRVVSKQGKPFTTAGYHLAGKQIKLRELRGTLRKQAEVKMRGRAGLINAWDLEITDKDSLQSGYSGSPVVDKYGYVIGVVNTDQAEGKTGAAISIEALKQAWSAWPDMPPDLFRQRRFGSAKDGTIRSHSGNRIRPLPRKIFALFQVPRQTRGSALTENVLEGPAKSAAPQPFVSLPNQSSGDVAAVPYSPVVPSEDLTRIQPDAKIPRLYKAFKFPPDIPILPHISIFSRKNVQIALIAILLVISSSILLYINITNQITKIHTQATATTSALNTTVAGVQATSTAEVATFTAGVQATSTVSTLATSIAIAEAPNPYGGTLVINDPMSGPGSTFNWAQGNDSRGDECNFKDGAYHVFGQCAADNYNIHVPAKFAFEIHLVAGFSCGELGFYFDLGGTGPKDITFLAQVCQDGGYDLSSLIDPDGADGGSDQQGSAGQSMHTGLDQPNIVGVVADGTHVVLYLNYVKVASIPDTNTLPGTLTLWGDNSTREFNREVIYTDARLWSL